MSSSSASLIRLPYVPIAATINRPQPCLALSLFPLELIFSWLRRIACPKYAKRLFLRSAGLGFDVGFCPVSSSGSVKLSAYLLALHHLEKKTTQRELALKTTTKQDNK